MEQLSSFKAAQTLILVNKKASLQDLLKVTCMDLVLRNVLTLAEIDKQVAPNQHPRRLTFVKTGELFRNYKAAKYENILLEPFRENPGLEIMFNSFMNRSYEKARGEKRFKRLIIESNRLSSYYAQNIVEQVFGGYSLTEAGEKLRNEVEAEIAELKARFANVKDQSEEMKSLAQKIGGNIAVVLPDAINTYQDYSFKSDPAGTTASTGSDLLMWVALSEWSDDFIPASGSGAGIDDFDAD